MADTLKQQTINQPLTPTLGDAVPKRGNHLTKTIALFFLRITGWRIAGEIPNVPKLIVIGAPHTSYWDFFLAMMIVFSLGIRIEIMGKATLFKYRPVAALLYWSGVFPARQNSSGGMVETVAATMNGRKKMFLGLSPEGTRKKVTQWRTGFYHIAQKTNLDILSVQLDFGRKTVFIHPPFTPTGQMDQDMQKIKAYFQDAIGKHAEQF